jgi:hypothetical protein
MNRRHFREVRFNRNGMGWQAGRVRHIAAAVIALAAITPAAPPAHATDTPADPTVIWGGFSAAGGRSAAGPYAAVLLYDLPDASPSSIKAASAPTASVRTRRATAALPPDPQPSDSRESHQVAAALGGPHRLVLATRVAGQWQQVEVARADRIDGPVCPKETTSRPVLAWTQRRGTQWELCVYRDGKTNIIASASRLLRCPLVAFSTGNGLIAGCESDDDTGEAVIVLYDETGARILSVPGRHGRLAACPTGLFLLAERATADAIWLEVTAIKNGQPRSPVVVRGPRDYTFNADLSVTCRPLPCSLVWTTHSGTIRIQLPRGGLDAVALKSVPIAIEIDRP